MYLQEGEILTIQDLLYGLMLESGNDAAVALAVAVGGTVERFVMLMNEKAAELGLKDTHFENPHGLPNDNHYTTALDLARLTDYALGDETFSEIVATKKTTACKNYSAWFCRYHNIGFSALKPAVQRKGRSGIKLC